MNKAIEYFQKIAGSSEKVAALDAQKEYDEAIRKQK